jgi:transposase
MGMPELVVTAVLVEGRSKSEVARDHGVSRRWVITLVQRYLAEGDDGLQPRSRRPLRSPTRTADELEDEIVAIRKDLARHGHEAGAATIAAHLQRRHGSSPAVSTIWRILTARGFVTPQPHKRPKSSYARFQAAQPRAVAGRHHPLAAGRRHRRRDPQLDRRPLPVLPDQHHRRGVHRARRRPGLPRPRPPRRPGTTAPSSPAATEATAGSPSRSPCTPEAWCSPTPGPTTRRPAARSNASTRPRRSGWPTSHPRPPTGNCKPSWTPSATTTTTSGPPSRRPPHSGRGLHRPTQGQRLRHSADRRPLPGPPRQDRGQRQADPAAQQPAAPHRHRPPLRRHTRPRAGPRPARPRAQHQRTTTPGPDPRPDPGLPTTSPDVNDVAGRL